MKEQVLMDYLEGTLDEVSRLLVQEHLKTCIQCKTRIDTYLKFFGTLDQLATEEVELPKELDNVLDKVYETYEYHQRLHLVRDYLTIQKTIFKGNMQFVQYVPGTNLGKKAVKSMWRGAIKVSGFALKKGYKRVAKGVHV